MLFLPLADAPVDRDALPDLYDCGEDGHSLSFPYSTRTSIESWPSGLVERGRNIVVVDGERLDGHAVLTPATAEEPGFGAFVDPASGAVDSRDNYSDTPSRTLPTTATKASSWP